MRILGTNQVLVYAVGASVQYEWEESRVGCAISYYAKSTIGFRLEDHGSNWDVERETGRLRPLTVDRAALRAAIAACIWAVKLNNMGVVLATDSQYVVTGATKMAKIWANNHLDHTLGLELADTNLWRSLMWFIMELHDEGNEPVLFWHITSAQNQKAIDSATHAASGRSIEDYDETYGQ